MFDSETNIFARWKAIGLFDVQLGYWTDGTNYWFIGADPTHFFVISCLESHPQIKSELISFANSDGSTWTGPAMSIGVQRFPACSQGETIAVGTELLTEEILRNTNPDELIKSFKNIAWQYIANQKH